MLGDDYNPSHLRLFMMNNVSPKKVGELKSDNTRARKLMANVTCLINSSISDADGKMHALDP